MKQTPLPKRGQIPTMTITVPATSTISVENLLEKWTQLYPEEKQELIATLNAGRIDRWTNDWPQFVHHHQKPPALAGSGKPWTTWLILGGRGAGKTRAGAEWVRGLALGDREYTDRAVGRIALIGETEHDVREVMIEGVSGLLAAHNRRERPIWIPSRRRLQWSNGAVAEAFSAEDPESLRGPQFGAAWADEIAKWRHADATFDMLQLGLRLGEGPR
jgi:phage terminase large subunit-like protein